MSAAIEADVAVVGAGVAGALVAAELAGDLGVVMLDAGPRIDRWQALQRFHDAVVKVPESPYPRGPANPFPRYHEPHEWYVQGGPDLFKATYLRAVGGTTWHWQGTAVRLVPDDFRMRSRFGLAVDWPIAYAELEPWYARAEEALGVAGDASDDLGSPRSTGYPLPPIPMSYSDRRFAAALAGTPYAAVRPTPQARNSVAYQDRPICCGAASCIPLCPIQAKYDGMVHVDLAERRGARVLPEAVVLALEAGADGRIKAARVKRADGSDATVRARAFVVAANAMETPRLLLNSAGERYPNGLANRSDQVGRNLMDHPIQVSWALANEPLWGYRGPLATAGIETFRVADFRGERPAFRVEVFNNGWNWPTGGAVTTAERLAGEGLRGRALDVAIRDEIARHATVATTIEQLPAPNNRVTLDPERRDLYGVPRPRIAYRLGDYEHRGLQAGRAINTTILGTLGVTGIDHFDEFESALHIMGTTRMGEDPRTSVVDPELRAHDHANLFLVGAGAFATGGVANPTLTIAALSLRAVEAVRASVAS